MKYLLLKDNENMKESYYNIPLWAIKKHLNINNEFVEDDSLIMIYLSTAIDAVEKHIDVSLDDITDDNGELPPSIKSAIFLMVGNLYANRESVAYSQALEIPTSYSYLLSLYKDYSCKKKNNICNCN